MSSERITSSGGWSGKSQALMAAAGVGLAGLGLAAGLMLRSPSVDTESAAVTANTTKLAANSNTNSTKSRISNQTPQRAAERPPVQTQAAALCAYCGVIEGVRPVQRKGEGSGVGAVAGGVVGAVVGNQMGGGSGKTAMTVLGALGGGVAGNEIEKRTKTTTVYEVRVRMDDGSLRTFTSATAPAPGAPVTVDGQTFRVVQSNSSAQRLARTMS